MIVVLMICIKVDEKANILRNQKVTREAEAEWLAKALSRMELEEVVYLLLRLRESGGKVRTKQETQRL
jgi:predicted RNA-binding Zn ribbon-like protein